MSLKNIIGHKTNVRMLNCDYSIEVDFRGVKIKVGKNVGF